MEEEQEEKLLTFRGGDLSSAERDKGFMENDPNLNRFQNALKYMRQNPDYLPPNPWPEGMAIYIIQGQVLYGITFVTLDVFESFTETSFFHLFKDCDYCIFCPVAVVPADDSERELFASEMLKDPNFKHILQYMQRNGWWVKNPNYVDYTRN